MACVSDIVLVLLVFVCVRVFVCAFDIQLRVGGSVCGLLDDIVCAGVCVFFFLGGGVRIAYCV